MKTITRGVHQIGLSRGLVNVLLLETTDGIVLIDTGFRGSEDAILAAMKELGFAPCSSLISC